MPIDGLFGTRADFIIDSILIFFIAAPFIMYFSLRLAKSGKHRTHRKIQVGLLLAMLIAVLILELSIRFGSVTDAVAASAFADTWILFVIFSVHLSVAVPTLLSWITLTIFSWSRFLQILPGGFSFRHILWGRLTFFGLCLTSATGFGLYVMEFVL